jgi:hypothetical protein
VTPRWSRAKDLLGKRFGRLTVTERIGWDRWGAAKWLCRCDCGKQTQATTTALLRVGMKSCGCFSREILSTSGAKSAVHKQAFPPTPEYHVWLSMNARCRNSRDKAYKFYGGRGIVVCQRWRKFENFFADMGKRPTGYTLERINNDGPYDPNNCKWATWEEQRLNQRQKISTFLIDVFRGDLRIHSAVYRSRSRQNATSYAKGFFAWDRIDLVKITDPYKKSEFLKQEESE